MPILYTFAHMQIHIHVRVEYETFVSKKNAGQVYATRIRTPYVHMSQFGMRPWDGRTIICVCI